MPGSTDDTPEPRRRRGRPRTIDRVAALDATRRVIARRGLDRVRYADIADESGIAVSTLQHAFGRLEEILDLALQRARDLEVAFLASLPSAEQATPWERIEALIGGAMASPLHPAPPQPEPSLDGWLVWLELWRAASRDDAAETLTLDAYERWWQATAAIIADGQADGSFDGNADPGELAIAINALIDGAAVSLLIRRSGGDLEAARRVVLVGARRMLSPR